MTRAKPLPYRANQLKDLAIMANSMAAKELLTIIRDNQISPEERMRRLGMALHHIHESTMSLKAIDNRGE